MWAAFGLLVFKLLANLVSENFANAFHIPAETQAVFLDVTVTQFGHKLVQNAALCAYQVFDLQGNLLLQDRLAGESVEYDLAHFGHGARIVRVSGAGVSAVRAIRLK